ncbi:MAG: aspartate carbamoyltransferase [Candidatus Woesearchaeota archaeon]|nr:aspartate carbamoyltransferase [Candidatus Woesearchaeota archaeon]
MFTGKSIIDVHSLTRDEIEYILTKAAEIKQALQEKKPNVYNLARNKELLAALLFYENSTRTKNSFEIAAKRLGLETVGFAGTEGTSVKKGESLKHTLDMFHAYGCDVVIMRHHLDGAAKYAADYLDIPVFNAGDGQHEHPTQTLLDLFTIKEHLGKLTGIDIGMGGDLKYGRTVHSLAIALAKFRNVRLHLYSHKLLAMPKSILTYLKEHKVKVTVHSSFEKMLKNVDVFYQTRIQKERMPDPEEFEKAKDACRFTLKHMELTKKKFGIMHPLPINKEYPSIEPDVDYHEKALYKTQAGNGVPTRLAEIALSLGLLGKDFKGKTHTETAPKQTFMRELKVKKQEKKTDQSLKPIRDEGTVIDHLQAGTAQKLMYLLKVEERGDIYRGGTVRRLSNRRRLKAMLMIESRTLTDDEMKVVAAISPKCRVNTIQKGDVVKKVELRMPEVIENVKYLKCKNSNCITRVEFQEHITPKFIRAGKKILRCHYCDHLQEGKDLL